MSATFYLNFTASMAFGILESVSVQMHDFVAITALTLTENSTSAQIVWDLQIAKLQIIFLQNIPPYSPLHFEIQGLEILPDGVRGQLF